MSARNVLRRWAAAMKDGEETGLASTDSLVFTDTVDMNGNKIDLDADADTSITADTDDQIDIEIGGADDFRFAANSFQVLSGSSALFAEDCACQFGGLTDLGAILYSGGDADNEAMVFAVPDDSQALHISDYGARATDWNISATTHPVVYIHSNTTPATDYLAIGNHSGTAASIEVVGGTTLTLTGAGNGIINVADGKSLVVGASGSPGTFGGGNFIGLEDSGTDPSGTYTNSLALYTPDAGDSLDFLHADGTTDTLGT